ncbi:MAG: FAD-dependent oxidoreductase [Caldilineales bacterium]
MSKALSRRDFLKIAAATGGVAAAAGVGIPLLAGEKDLVFPVNDSYWAREQPQANAPLAEDITVDVAIIGGGYTGLSSAWHLATRAPGLKIALLEARQCGHGASGRHGGMVLSQPGVEAFEIMHDLETHKRTYDVTAAGMKELQQVVQSTGIDCDLQLEGFLHTFLDEEDRPYYEEYLEEARQAGIPVELWDAEQTAHALGSERFAGAMFDPNGGSVHAMKLVKAQKAAAMQAGAVIYEDSAVLDIEEGELMRLRVGAAGHTVTAPAIVLATNAYTSKLGYFQSQVMPVHAQTAVTTPLSTQQLEAIAWNSRLPFYDSRNMLFHVVLTPDNRIVVGGGDAKYEFRNDLQYRGNLKQVGEMMLNELIVMYPALQGIRFDYVWDGVLGMSYDGTPSVGVTGKHRNIYHGLAYSGQGVNLSWVFGDVIAALHQGQPHPWLETPYGNNKLPYIPPEPFRWIGAEGMMKYYSWQDRRANQDNR